jgi:predicted RNA-binding protein
LARPEIQRHRRKMLKGQYRIPRSRKILLLLPEAETKPYSRSRACMKIKAMLSELRISKKTHVCFYNPVFGVVPIELDDLYPLSQFEVVQPYSETLIENLAIFLADFIKARKRKYKIIILHFNPKLLDLEKFKDLDLRFSLWTGNPWSDEALNTLKIVLAEAKFT